ncbi:hypothetical protein [Saccharopolyspora shandongensis]|uniref:hypothetical protein n=1 Tax=Saccharopolyspora shandongensis TaxID=418495 RepID=UPI0033E90EE0
MLTTADLEAAIDFYIRVLGVEVTTFREERKPLVLGVSKINLDRVGHGSAVVATRFIKGSLPSGPPR